MHSVLALVRARWLSASSYRINIVMSFLGLFLTVVPVYFISRALQPMMGDVIRHEGSQYFAFVLVGMITLSLIAESVNALPTAINSGISTGTLEALLSTPTSIPVLLAGLTGYSYMWTAVRSLAMMIVGVVFGASVSWPHVPAALLVLVLVVLSYLPFGLLAASLVVAFRSTGPLVPAVLLPSTFLGGVYYPTHVIPSWIERVSAFVPLTYGLRALRRVLLEGQPLTAVWSDLAVVLASTAVLLLLSVYVFSRALQYARKTGSLAHY